MANIKFIIRNPKAKAAQSINLLFHLERGDKLLLPVGLKINPAHWNNKQGKVKDITEATNKDIINNFLNVLKTDFERELTRKAAEKEPITKDSLKTWVIDYLNPKPVQNNDNSFHGYFKKFLNDLPNVKNQKTDKPIVFNTIRKFHQLYDLIKQYEKNKSTLLTWDKITLDFYFDFVSMMEGKNLAQNTIGKFIKSLKYFLNCATEQGINTNTAYKSTRFKTIAEKTESIYLNESDLKTLETLDLSDKPKLDKIRDLFLVGCWTGLRFSDFTNIKHENIFTNDAGKFIDIEQQKTKSKVVVPIVPIVETILNKYGGSLPKAPTNQKFNEYIKEVAKFAEYNEIISMKQTRGGKATAKMKPKFAAISSHTARRSFASNMFRRKFPTPLIMAITGHKTEKTFMDYVKITPTEKAEMLQELMIKSGMFLKVV